MENMELNEGTARDEKPILSSSREIANHFITRSVIDTVGISIPLVEKLVYWAHASYLYETDQFLVGEIPVVGEFGPHFPQLRERTFLLAMARAKYFIQESIIDTRDVYEGELEPIDEGLVTVSKNQWDHIDNVWKQAKLTDPTVEGDPKKELDFGLFTQMNFVGRNYWNENFYKNGDGAHLALTTENIKEIYHKALTANLDLVA